MSDSSHTAEFLEARLAELERRVTALEAGPTAPDLPTDEDGSVAFGGNVSVGGNTINYQWERPTSYLTDREWVSSFHRIAALAGPIRGEILRRLLDSPATVAELVDEGVFTSTGKAYHHLNDLIVAGWVAKDTQGRHEIPASRVVPLLAIVAAGEDH